MPAQKPTPSKKSSQGEKDAIALLKEDHARLRGLLA
jgi:hypothetical protein